MIINVQDFYSLRLLKNHRNTLFITYAYTGNGKQGRGRGGKH